MERTCFDILSELFARDIDMDLLRRSMAKTPTERIIWLEEMQAFAEELKKGTRDARTRDPGNRCTPNSEASCW